MIHCTIPGLRWHTQQHPQGHGRRMRLIHLASGRNIGPWNHLAEVAEPAATAEIVESILAESGIDWSVPLDVLKKSAPAIRAALRSIAESKRLFFSGSRNTEYCNLVLVRRGSDKATLAAYITARERWTAETRKRRAEEEEERNRLRSGPALSVPGLGTVYNMRYVSIVVLGGLPDGNGLWNIRYEGTIESLLPGLNELARRITAFLGNPDWATVEGRALARERIEAMACPTRFHPLSRKLRTWVDEVFEDARPAPTPGQAYMSMWAEAKYRARVARPLL